MIASVFDGVDALSPSRWEDRTFKPSFFFKWPLTKPRTLCVCQPVARMMARRVAPSGCCSSASNLGAETRRHQEDPRQTVVFELPSAMDAVRSARSASFIHLVK